MDKTVNVNQNHIQLYAQTIRILLNENVELELESKMHALVSLYEQEHPDIISCQTLLDELNDSCINSYFNGASDKEMQIFSDMAGGKFFGDTAFDIIKSIIEYNEGNNNKISNMLNRYISDRTEFLDLAQKSIDKLIRMGLIQAHV